MPGNDDQNVMWVIALQVQRLSILLLLMFSTVHIVSGVQFVFQVGGGDFALQSSDSSVPPSWSSNRLWLTPDPDTTKTGLQSEAVGRVVYNHAIPLFNESTGQVVSFNTSFNFTIVTNVEYGNGGDGMAFSISPLHELPANSSGGSLGIVATSNNTDLANIPDRHLFAVEFDTFANLQYMDPSSSHIGIDFNGLTSTSTFDSSDPLSDLYLYFNYTIFAWVEYIAPLHLTRVFAATSSQRPLQPCVNATFDLSDLFDPNQNLYAAISAASGEAVQGSALFSWTFASEDVGNTPSPSPPLKSPPPPPPPDHPPAPSPSPRPSPSTLALSLTLSLSGVLLLAAAGTLVYCKRRRRMFPAMMEMIPSTGLVPRHSYRELKKATQGFSDKQKVGEGGFSSVYKGTLSTGDVVAVKRLKEGLRMEAEFASEIQIISRIRHRNLMQLRGWCYEGGEALLVYQYMPNGSLDRHLFGKKRGHPELLDGEKRFGILVGVAAALEYLHEGLGECVLHRDVKAANVMLTERFEAMLGDFGLARLITHNQAVTMTAAGTPGYVAPEVVYTGRATGKADVYSFGMLALEVACGRRAWDESRPPEEMRLLDWVWLLQQSGKLMDALDPACYSPVIREQHHYQHIHGEITRSTNDSARGQIVEEPLIIAPEPEDHMTEEYCYSLLQDVKWQCVLHVALLCCNPWPEDRPTMRQLHQTLRDSSVLPLPSTRPTFSRPAASITPSIEFSISSSSPSAALGPPSFTSPSSPPSAQNVFSF